MINTFKILLIFLVLQSITIISSEMQNNKALQAAQDQVRIRRFLLIEAANDFTIPLSVIRACYVAHQKAQENLENLIFKSISKQSENE